MLHKILKFVILLTVGFSLHCSSGTYYVKRETPDTTFARADRGDVVYSASDFRYDNDRQRVIYRYWKFEKSDSKSVTLVYEEYLDFIKIQPDVKEEKVYEIGKDYQIRLQDMILEVYQLTSKSMVYYIKSGR